MPEFLAAFDLGPVTKTMAQLVTPLFNLGQGADGLIAFFQGLGGNQPSALETLAKIFGIIAKEFQFDGLTNILTGIQTLF